MERPDPDLAEDVAKSRDRILYAVAVAIGGVGFVIGMSGPLGACGVGAGIVCGPSGSGLLLMATIVVVVVSLVTFTITDRGGWVFAMALMLAIGIFAGNVVAHGLGWLRT
jgi:hypothetical protein